MAIGSIGLKTAIWNNNIKSILLLASFPLLLLAMLWAFFVAYEYSMLPPSETMSSLTFHAGGRGLRQYGHFVFIGVALWFTVAFLWHQSMVNKATGAHSVTRTEQPRIYNILENLCISRGLTMPSLQIIDSTALNAFASGITDKSYSITLTTGIIETLDDDELEAVMAHELTHIMNRDVRLLIISIIFVGMISFACDMLWRNMRFSGRSKGKGAAMGMLIAAIILAIGYLFSIAIRFALSRRREFMADAGAVELTKNPSAMISALQKISGNSTLPSVTGDFREMMIDNDRSEFVSFFATHPPISQRIMALQSFGGQVEETKPQELWK